MLIDIEETKEETQNHDHYQKNRIMKEKKEKRSQVSSEPGSDEDDQENSPQVIIR